MKKFLSLIALLSLFAGCSWWNKKSDTMTTLEEKIKNDEHTNLQDFEKLMGEAEEDDNYLGQAVNGEEK